jgi:hypothetical protein
MSGQDYREKLYKVWCSNHVKEFDEKYPDEKPKKVSSHEDELICVKCGIDQNDDLILLCDKCDRCFHTYCLDPPLSEIPEGDWFCSECLKEKENDREMIMEKNKQQEGPGMTIESDSEESPTIRRAKKKDFLEENNRENKIDLEKRTNVLQFQ